MDKLFLKRFLHTTPFFCAIMVVGIHSYNVVSISENSIVSVFESIISHGICTAAVPIFLMISGYLFYRNANSMHDVIEKQKRRVLSLLLPFVVWSLFYYLVYIVLYKFGMTTVSVNISFFGMLKAVVFYEYVFPLWFLFQLIVYTVIAPILLIILKNPKIAFLFWLVAGILGIAMVSFKITVDDNERTIFAFNYFTYYFLGALLSKNTEIFLRIEKRISQIPISVGIICWIITGCVEGLCYDFFDLFNNRLFVPIVALCAFAVFDNNRNNIEVKETGITGFISRIPTFMIYTVHPFIGLIVRKMLDMVGMAAFPQYIVSFFVCAVLSVICACIIKKIPVLRFIFNGNRT